MLSGIIAYQILQQENPPIIEKAKAVLENIPGTRTNGRRSFKMFPLLTARWCCLCRQQGGQMTFAPGQGAK
jgi:hypothetical protein